jgi:mono/diheme cytochrome c family protein
MESNSDVPYPPDAGSLDAGPDAVVEGSCQPAQSDPIPPRPAALIGGPKSEQKMVFVDDLFGLVVSHCGGCHVDGSQGNVHTDRASFSTLDGQNWLDSIIKLTDPTYMMPPASAGGIPYKDRLEGDPIKELARLLEAWIKSGQPNGLFYQTVTSPGDQSPFRMRTEVGDAMTVIGNCVPNKALYATEPDEMQKLDDKFLSLAPAAPGKGTLADQIGLMERLEDTDLFTLDSEMLARRGVISYSVAYPTFYDGTKKLRHVRVPLGESIKFNPNTQQFEIPGNTRFYRTDLQPIIQQDGTTRWRKMETRLIVAWPDDDTRGQGRFAVTSFFGVYVWNDDETEAVLLTDPLRSGAPWRDRVSVYVSDEAAAAKIQASRPINLAYALQNGHAVRRYAVPGERRCTECHIGSPSQNFVVGFQPLQIRRREHGQGGVQDQDIALADDLGQLGRFIDYGLVTGLSSPEDVIPLEASQGSRTPRNDNELAAQGYMLGNCANCHSPRGTASVNNKMLGDVLNFQPGTGTKQGIFQFPLENYSPRIFRGPDGTVPMPYVTPSLMDLPVAESFFYVPKCQGAVMATGSGCIPAPWRSLLYRGVDTPFTYSDDFALMPHMPMNTPGFDCRVPRIMAEWMVSIPAVRKSPDTLEFYPSPAPPPLGVQWPDPTGKLTTWGFPDTNPQPYDEAALPSPGTPEYHGAAAQTETRLNTYLHPTSFSADWFSRYDFCPDTSDIMDPAVLLDPGGHPVPVDGFITKGGATTMPNDGVPNHAHWVVLDQTQIPGPWYPRRFDWQSILVDGAFPDLSKLIRDPIQLQLAQAAQDHEKLVVEELQNATLSDKLWRFATQQLPVGLWADNANCDFSSVPTVASYAANRSAWMDRLWLPKDSPRPVYLQSPGEFVHTLICSNCHGPLGDSSGRQATLLSEMTGGNATVSNLRQGVSRQDNRQRVFGPAASTDTTADDWGARYFDWMGLGGTKQTIPASILAVVASTKVLGVPRPRSTASKDANMLATAENLCKHMLPLELGGGSAYLPKNAPPGNLWPPWLDLIVTNGDAELWGRLCAIDNPAPVRAIWYQWIAATQSGSFTIRPLYDYYPASLYPPSAQVADHLSRVAPGLKDNNLFPWCIRKPQNAETLAHLEDWRATNLSPDGTPYPLCPEMTAGGDPYVPASDDVPPSTDPHLAVTALERWAIRGAINAGNAAFLHLDAVARGVATPSPAYNECPTK